MLHEFGYDLEAAPKAHVTNDDGDVVSIHIDAASRAKSLYSKIIGNTSDKAKSNDNENIIHLSSLSTERLDGLMNRDLG